MGAAIREFGSASGAEPPRVQVCFRLICPKAHWLYLMTLPNGLPATADVPALAAGNAYCDSLRKRRRIDGGRRLDGPPPLPATPRHSYRATSITRRSEARRSSIRASSSSTSVRLIKRCET